MKEQGKKKKKRHNQVTFKPYEQHQIWLLPPSLGELIPDNHIVRLVNEIIDGMNIAPLLATYEGGGTSSYHPRLLLKALVYGYLDKKYSSRSIEKACRENICYMWLCGMQQPDHNTLNRFRKERMSDTVKNVFAQVLSLLVKQGYVRLSDYHIDGTKMESAAGRYTYVWAKNVERYQAGLLDKIARIIEEIESVNDAAEAEAKQSASEPRVKVSDSAALQAKITQLNEDLAEQLQEKKKLRTKLNKLEKEHLPKLREYESHRANLAGRNSYSKTDVDATFMRTKDDHLGNGQLKPCYNWQFGTENQFIINYTVHQTASDMVVFTQHMDSTLELLDEINAPNPKRASADAGYGSEENYEYLAEKGIEAYVKYPGYYAESNGKKTPPKQVFSYRYLHYNEAEDYFVCPMGQHMAYTGSSTKKTKTGYEQTLRHYQAARCQGCPLQRTCYKSKEPNRVIRFNRKAYFHRKAARQRLHTLRGIRIKKQRNVDIEAVFGHIKHARSYRRFLLCGLKGVETETGILALAHNIKKLWRVRTAQRISLSGPIVNPPNVAALAVENTLIHSIRA